MNILTRLFFAILLALEFHGPFSFIVVPFRVLDDGPRPDIELHCTGVKFKPIRKFVLWCKDLILFSLRLDIRNSQIHESYTGQFEGKGIYGI